MILGLRRSPGEGKGYALQYSGLENSMDWSMGCITGFPCGSAGKESACNVGHLGSIPGLGRSPGEGKGYPLQYSGLENSMECIVHKVAKSRTWLINFHFHCTFSNPGNPPISDPPQQHFANCYFLEDSFTNYLKVKPVPFLWDFQHGNML